MSERGDLDYPVPSARRLRVYAFDPQASVKLSTAVINDSVIELPWEARWEAPLTAGPTNEYVEVIDVDPASGLFYSPIDLNAPALLAQNGLAPSEGRPQFHQQMVFAVAMRTIRAFERALGRPVLWARDKALDKLSPSLKSSIDPVERNFTRTLRIYPHAIRDRNAYYSPEKRALLFGYFRPEGAGARDVDANWVFTCLSQDIVAHETTHAILHGMQQRSIEPANVDALAFHEAFADIVALLLHFDSQEVVRHLLAQSGGSLRSPGLLIGLAEQFGTATGRKGALRYALVDLLKARAEQVDSAPRVTTYSYDREDRLSETTLPEGATIAYAYTPKGKLASETRTADQPLAGGDMADMLRATTEPHRRGAFLVAAVFDAFVTIFERRTSDLFLMAGRRPGDPNLPSPLVTRLASEAARTADQAMRMCVRALDYIPPVDLHFGEYLRAIITADMDLVPDDPMRYRVAFCEAFRRWGIRVPGAISMAPDSLAWDRPRLWPYANALSNYAPGMAAEDALDAAFTGLLAMLQLSVTFSGGAASYDRSDYEQRASYRAIDVPARNLRDLAMHIVLHNQSVIHDWFEAETPIDDVWESLVGLHLRNESRKTARRLGSLRYKNCDGKKGFCEPVFDVNSARISRRFGPDGQELHLLIIQLTQRRRGYFDPVEQTAADRDDYRAIGNERTETPDFWFRGGATIHVDLRDGRLLRIISKRIDDDDRLRAEVAFRTGDETGTVAAVTYGGEPFAFMHGEEDI